ncbi:MAG: SUKH-3 domain-containing protein [Oscillospiraceae bacterium]|nr:SUKH-3 domain-containing protein [Oscillospiraceae bacterium]
MELNGLSDRAEKLIISCGYGRQRFMSEDSMSECMAFFDEEGYRLSEQAKEIINDFYMLSIGKHGQFCDGKFVITENEDIENKMVVYPENIYDAAHLFKQLSDAMKDYIVPLGLINDDFFAIGESGKVYIIADDVFVAGESWVDFLNNFADNFSSLSNK